MLLLAEPKSYGYQPVVRIHQAGVPDVAEDTVYPRPDPPGTERGSPH
jgi:hypothetical protein